VLRVKHLTANHGLILSWILFAWVGTVAHIWFDDEWAQRKVGLGRTRKLETSWSHARSQRLSSKRSAELWDLLPSSSSRWVWPPLKPEKYLL
jgi:hypothetical protein